MDLPDIVGMRRANKRLIEDLRLGGDRQKAVAVRECSAANDFDGLSRPN